MSAPSYFRMNATAVSRPGDRLRVLHSFQATIAVHDPASGVITRPEIAARSEPSICFNQRKLHALLAAEFDERRHAVSKQLDHGEHRIELERRVKRDVAGFR